jgi:hypothetical protein
MYNNEVASEIAKENNGTQQEKYKLTLEFETSSCQDMLNFKFCVDRLIQQTLVNDSVEIVTVKIPNGFVYNGGSGESHEILVNCIEIYI